MVSAEKGAEKYPFGLVERVDLHPRYAELRRDALLAKVTMPFGGEAWLATRHADVRTVLSDPRFSRAAAVSTDSPRLTPQTEDETLILSMDPPRHTRLRGLIAKAFTARQIAEMRPRIQRIIDDLLDTMIVGGKPADFFEALALALPITVICELLGIPSKDRNKFKTWTDEVTALSTDRLEAIMEARDHLDDYLVTMIAQRRAEPTEDLLGLLVAARDNNDRLSERELVTFGVTLLVSGYETTANQTGNFLYLLLSERDKWQRLVAEPELVPTAVEELLRFTPLGTAGGFTRIATEDVQLNGGLVRAGEAIVAQMASANRDESVFDHPDELDFNRSENPHISFGHGPHHCVGAQLARMELQLALSTLIRRLPGLRLAVPPNEVPWKTNRMIRGVAALPVTW